MNFLDKNNGIELIIIFTSGGRARSFGFMTIIVVSSSSVSMNSARPYKNTERKIFYDFYHLNDTKGVRYKIVM